MSVHRYAVAVLKALEGRKWLSFSELQETTKLGPDALRWALESLSEDKYIELKMLSVKNAILSDEAKSYAENGMPEEELAKMAGARKVNVSELSSSSQKIGLQWAKIKGYIVIEKGTIQLTEKGVNVAEKGSEERKLLVKLMKDPQSYQELNAAEKSIAEELVKRKLIRIEGKNIIESVSITANGIKAAKSENAEEEIDELNKKVIANREWEEKNFKKYDVELEVERLHPATRHPLKATIDSIKDAYAAMGFKEVNGPVIEPAFWVFDFLFVPQNHPARDKQDTFYLSEPSTMKIEDTELIKRVKEIHESSWNMEWSEKVASEAVLRTHTTSVSAHQIYEIAKSKENNFPIKLFSVGRVFRNENIDYKHAADFYQTDGIIIGEKLTLANLFDTLTKIYSSLGIKIRFKPAYFPFVEPGVEVQLFYEPKKEWLEMGGAGMIRKEIIGAAGRKNMSVLAWGLGVERILIANNSDISSILEMYNNGIGWLRKRRVP